MFGTLRLNSNKPNNDALVQKPVDPASSRPAVQQACQSCRLKKVRCSGKRPACSRCNTLSKPCVYSSRPPGKAKAKTRKRNVGEPSTHGTEQDTTQQQSASNNRQGSILQDSLVVDPDEGASENGPHLHNTVQPKLNDAPEATTVPEATGDVTDGGDPDDTEMMSWPSPDFMDNTLFTSDKDQFEQPLGTDFVLPSTAAPASLCSTATTGSSVNDDNTSSAETVNSVTNMTTLTTYGLENFHLPDTASGSASSQVQSTADVDLSLFKLWYAGPVPALSSINPGPIHSGTGSSGLISPAMAPDFALLTGSSSSGVEEFSHTARSPPRTPRSLLRGEQCKCLTHVTLLIYELETSRPDTLDGQLASHKEAVDFGRTLLQCQKCSQRPENLMQLLFLTNGLLKLSDALVNTLVSLQINRHKQQQQQQQQQQQPQPQQVEATVRLSKSHRRGEHPVICFGELEIDSTPEWEVMVASLIAMHLSAMQKLITQLEQCSENMNVNNVRLRASHAKESTGHMIKMVQRVSSMPREAV